MLLLKNDRLVQETVEEILVRQHAAFNEVSKLSTSYEEFRACREFEYAYVAAQSEHVSDTVALGHIQDHALNAEIFTQQIERPACLHGSGVEKMAELGYEVAIESAIDSGNAGYCEYAVVSSGADFDHNEFIQALGDWCFNAGSFGTGAESGPYRAANGQSVTINYHKESSISVNVTRLELIVDRDKYASVPTATEILNAFKANYEKRMLIGVDFSHQDIFQIDRDAPYASAIICQWNTDGLGVTNNDVYYALFNEKAVLNMLVDDVVITYV